jgi:predicted metalloendopeptidase
MARGINPEHIDIDVRPEYDFYHFVNGRWIKETEIPEDRSSWGSFHELSKSTDQQNLEILDHVEPQTSNLAAILYETGTNTESIESSKLDSVFPLINELSEIQDSGQLSATLGSLTARGLGGLLQFSVHPDLGDSHIYSAYLEPGSLGLPDRDFYLDQDDRSVQIRERYLNYISHLLHVESNYDEEKAKTSSRQILSLEKQLAAHMLPKEERRQIEKLYNPYSFEELLTLCPAVDWNSFFIAMQIRPPSRIIVTEPEYFRFLNELIQSIQPDEIISYLTFLVIHHAAPYAHSALEEVQFDMYSRFLEGVAQMKPRRERVVRVVNHYLGDALGQLFVEKYFPPSAKDAALEMMDDIVAAFRNRIKQLEWMRPSTKKYALEKLEAIRIKIGYPDKWKEYENLKLESPSEGGHYLSNLLKAEAWKFRQDASRIGQQVDREEWFMAPQVVNAYYNPMFNEIVFPAAILQPPFFDWQADAAVNYGGIGAVIGHEITHGFDDQGSRFDKDGNLNEWWTMEDRNRFQELTKQLVEQFDAYYPFEDLSLNGTFTLGENIADLGGLSVAYDALQLYHQRHGVPEPIDGFTADQRFFMSWATVWRTKIRPDALRHQIKTDPHPPGLYRAVAAPSNLDSFYDAFNIHQDSPWFRKHEDRIKIW